jgi:hypothetical protein
MESIGTIGQAHHRPFAWKIAPEARKYGHDFWRPCCVCGWQGKVETLEYVAKDAARKHASEAVRS